jgi:hypothetical protein
LAIKLGAPPTPTNACISYWDDFFHALRERFYPADYLQNILTKWLKLGQLSTLSVQSYIDIVYKLRIHLHINDPEEVFLIKFNSGLLMHLSPEFDLFERSSLDKAFL